MTIIVTNKGLIDLRIVRKGDWLYDVFWDGNVPCNCCGRSLNELEPYGKSGDPLEGDFYDALLVKRSRPLDPPDEEAERIYEEFYGDCKTGQDREKAREKMVQRLGEKEAERIKLSVQLANTWASSWECRDCIVLDTDEYYEKKESRNSEVALGHG